MDPKLVLDAVHDANNKLSIASGHAHRLAKKFTHPSFNAVFSAMAAIQRILVNLRDVADGVDRGVCDLSVELSKSSEFEVFLRSLYGVTVRHDVSGDLPENCLVYGDATQKSTVLMNLVENAAKAGATEVVIRVKVAQKFVEVTVTDNGDGMTEEELAGLGFTGRGYSVVYRHVANHQGTVNVYSRKKTETEPGSTTVVLRLKRYFPEEVTLKQSA